MCVYVCSRGALSKLVLYFSQECSGWDSHVCLMPPSGQKETYIGLPQAHQIRGVFQARGLVTPLGVSGKPPEIRALWLCVARRMYLE